jgi:hypothetical protein
MLFIECDANETRYDYNLTIMESPKLAPDNRFKKINPKLPLKSNNVDFLRYCGSHFENGDR